MSSLIDHLTGPDHARTALATHTMPAEPVSVGSSAKTFTEDFAVPHVLHRQVLFVEDKSSFENPTRP